MNEAELRELLALLPDDPRLRRMRHRWINRTEHHVWIFDNRVVIKKYVLHPGKQSRWKTWNKERRAFRRLRGLAVPALFGYFATREANGLRAHVLFTEYLHGHNVAALEGIAIEEFAELMASIHTRDVVTNDPKPANLIRTEAGRLAFFDFGRATFYPLQGPVYWWYLGKELSRTYRKALREMPGNMAIYAPRYFAALGMPRGWRRILLQTAFRYWCRRKNVGAPPIFP